MNGKSAMELMSVYPMKHRMKEIPGTRICRLSTRDLLNEIPIAESLHPEVCYRVVGGGTAPEIKGTFLCLALGRMPSNKDIAFSFNIATSSVRFPNRSATIGLTFLFLFRRPPFQASFSSI